MSVDLVTFGCRLNAYESEVIRGACAGRRSRRYHRGEYLRGDRGGDPPGPPGDPPPAARTAGRPHRGHRLRRAGRARKLPRHARGRSRARQQREARGRFLARHARLFGRNPDDVPGRDEKAVVNDIMAVTETALHLIDGFDGRVRAFVQVQNGCDHRCTFCIIPFGRGNSRSVPMGEVVDQVRRLVARGYREVVLTGVDLTGYGAGLPGTPQARHAGEANSQARARARAAAAVLDRSGRGRPRPPRCARRTTPA